MEGGAGFWRRALAAAMDLIVAQLLLELAAAALFALSGGHVTSDLPPYTACRPATAVPAGVVVPPAFAGGDRQVCTSGVFGAATRVLFVARAGRGAPGATYAVPATPDGRAAARVMGTGGLQFPLFVLLRWLCDRFGGRQPGRRRQDAFYDAAAGTAVATRAEILFARDVAGARAGAAAAALLVAVPAGGAQRSPARARSRSTSMGFKAPPSSKCQ